MYPLNILLIEDQAITAADIKETLEKAGHRITAKAVNRQQALAAIEKEMPDLAIVDIHLEGSTEDGIAIVQEFFMLNSLPIIYLTANSETPTFHRALKTRPTAYLLKPFNNKELAFQVELAFLNQYEKLPRHSLYEAEALYIPVNKSHIRLEKRDILYVEAQGSYVKIFTTIQPVPFLLTMHLGHVIQYFSPEHFFRLSRSFLISLNHIVKIDSQYLYISNVKDPFRIPESSRTELFKNLTVVRTPSKGK